MFVAAGTGVFVAALTGVFVLAGGEAQAVVLIVLESSVTAPV